jgi:hypothetical protein
VRRTNAISLSCFPNKMFAAWQNHWTNVWWLLNDCFVIRCDCLMTQVINSNRFLRVYHEFTDTHIKHTRRHRWSCLPPPPPPLTHNHPRSRVTVILEFPHRRKCSTMVRVIGGVCAGGDVSGSVNLKPYLDPPLPLSRCRELSNLQLSHLTLTVPPSPSPTFSLVRVT